MSFQDACSGFGFPDSSPKTAMPDPADRDQDDDFVAGLVEQMAHSMLLEDEEGDGGDAVASTPPLPESAASAADCLWAPLHDLSALLQERRSGWNSTNTSPSPAVSPPTPLHHHFRHEADSQPQSDAWELLHMAAQEVMRLKMGASISSSSPPSPSEIRAFARHPSSSSSGGTPLYGGVSSAKNSDNKAAGSCPFGQQQLDTSWKQQQRSTPRHHSCYQTGATNQPPVGVIPTVWNRRARALQQQQQARQIATRNFSAGNSRPNIHHPAGSTLYSNLPQQWSVASNSNSSCAGGSSSSSSSSRNGSRMRAVFLRAPTFGSSTSNGTGVFLPQATTSSSSSGSSREQKRKHSCSSVLLPSRIVEVLNLNVDDINCHPGPPALGNNHVVPGSDGVVDEYLSAHLSKSYSACSPTRWHSAAEHALPTEWTY